MKKIIFTISVLASCAAYSQVGINTEEPKATLDVTGKPTDLTKTDGIIAPRLKGSELKGKDALYGTDQKASLVYVTEALAASDTTSKTVNVTSTGYFYFDGNVWQKLNTGNAGNNWSLLGNTGTNSNGNFVGTTDDVDLVFRTNNSEKMRVFRSKVLGNHHVEITGGDLLVNLMTVGTGGGNLLSNTVVGHEALRSNTTGIGNTVLGDFGLWSNTTGKYNIAVGGSALTRNISGEYNIAVGQSSLASNTEGNKNVALGQSALTFNTTGTRNIAIGYLSLSNSNIKTGNDNIAIGDAAASNLADGSSNNIVIGSQQQLPISANSNQLNIGGAIFGTGLNGSAAAPAGNIGIGTTNPATRLEVNNGTTNGAIKIVDGTEGAGKVLTSDANGVGTWRSSASFKSVVLGVFPSANVTTTSNLNSGSTDQQKYTGVYIDLEPGKWIVNAGLTIYVFEPNLTHWEHVYLSNSQTSIVQNDFQNFGPGSNVAFAGKISNGPTGGVDTDPQRQANFVTGSAVINVTTATRIYMLLENKPTNYWSYSTTAWENYLYAVPVN
ncbi:hypothetical protein [Chryseobacterium terrae]|uniref:Uncharacterized protein n=1 Tax=Chryseobacterium terrae TaxID=3163299 RepID=A0ABW8Y1B6_9FLAO